MLGVVADLLEACHESKHETSTFDARGGSDLCHHIGHDRRIQRCLFLGERNDLVGLGFWWQVRRDVWVGLAASEQEWPQEAVQLSRDIGVAIALDRGGEILPEPFLGAEQAGGRPIENGPQVEKLILDWCTGEREARSRRDRSKCPRRA